MKILFNVLSNYQNFDCIFFRICVLDIVRYLRNGELLNQNHDTNFPCAWKIQTKNKFDEGDENSNIFERRKLEFVTYLGF